MSRVSPLRLAVVSLAACIVHRHTFDSALQATGGLGIAAAANI
jgi:hypothetical protein